MKKLSFYVNKKIVYVNYEITNNKHAYLKVQNNKNLLVSAPKIMSQIEVQKFVDKHINKFVNYLEKIKKYQLYSIKNKFIFYQGTKFPIRILTGFSDNDVKIKNKIFYLHLINNSIAIIEKTIDCFLNNTLNNYLLINQVKYEKIMQLTKHKIKISKRIGVWGSNDLKNNIISYSNKLMHFAPPVIDYVIVHELAHCLEPNHSQSFWLIVKKYMPDYQFYKKQLHYDEPIIYYE